MAVWEYGPMSLHDVDKDSLDRGAPQTNSSDVLDDASVKAHKTISSHYKTDADTTTSRLQMTNKQIIGNTGTADVVKYGVQSDNKFALKFLDPATGVGIARFGQFADGTTALKVAKPTFEVDTTADANLIFNSNQNMFKIVATGTTTVTTPASLTNKQVVTSTIPHGLGYAPAFQAYVTVPNYGVAYVAANQLTSVPFTFFSYNITPLLYVYASSDASNLYLNVANLYDAALAGLGGVWTFRYYILAETAT